MGSCASRATSLQRVSEASAPGASSGSATSDSGRDERGAPSQPYLKRRRGSVSAEAGDGQAGAALHRMMLPKDEATCARLKGIVAGVTCFQGLSEAQCGQLVDAMFERHCCAGQALITAGQEGDFFYVVDHGRFVASKGGSVKRVYDGSGSFGELALMHNCPRAASVSAETAGVVWALDRAIFRALVVGGMEESRKITEASLRKIPTFRQLTAEQLAAIADCLATESFAPGEVIIAQGQPLGPESKFYIVESGRVDCFRAEPGAGGARKLTRSLDAGDVFGEVALLTNAPRQADCVAATKVTCLTMPRGAFERLMGPVEESLSRQIEEYKRLNAAAATAAAEAEAEAPQRMAAPPAAATEEGVQRNGAPDSGGAAAVAGPGPQSGGPGEGVASVGASFGAELGSPSGGGAPRTAKMAALNRVAGEPSPVPRSSPPRAKAQAVAHAAQGQQSHLVDSPFWMKSSAGHSGGSVGDPLPAGSAFGRESGEAGGGQGEGGSGTPRQLHTIPEHGATHAGV